MVQGSTIFKVESYGSPQYKCSCNGGCKSEVCFGIANKPSNFIQTMVSQTFAALKAFALLDPTVVPYLCSSFN
jgi:hypothetical protein